MQVAFAQSNLAGRAKTWALSLKLHDSFVFRSLEVFKSLFRQTFELPQAEFRARFELLKLKQGKRNVHSYIQYIRHLTSCITSNPPNEQTLITSFMQDLTDGPVRTYLFRLEFYTLKEVIRVAKQEDFSVKQAHVSSTPIVPRGDRKAEAQNRWTSVTLRVKAFALPIMRNCRDAIGVKIRALWIRMQCPERGNTNHRKQ